jgi:microcystin-dependent protein
MSAQEITLAMPVGSIVAFAGPIAPELELQGWLLCDGGELDATNPTYEALYGAIGSAYGSTAPDKFNVPQLQGAFLRGVSESSGRDPDAASRPASLPGGAIGNAPGSEEQYATAPPRNPFKATIPNGNVSDSASNGGCQQRAGVYRSGSSEIAMTGGGDLESRPVNKYVHYLIKYRTLTDGGDPVVPPIGAVIPFAGVDTVGITQSWLPCNGEPLSPKGEFKALFSAIGFAHGQIGTEQFILPDYQGYFLRGVSGASERDPDAGERAAPFPQGKPGEQGNAGNEVGSRQWWATAAPTGPTMLKTSFPNMPTEESGKRIGGSSWAIYHYNSETTTVDLTADGGDTETRPKNMAVDWYIRFRGQAMGEADSFPVGAVIPFAGTLPENSNWVLCDGRQFPIDTYPELCQAIGFTYGGSVVDKIFMLPDYRGLFLRGTGTPEGVDPDLDERVSLRANDAESAPTAPWASLPAPWTGRAGAGDDGESGGAAVLAPVTTHVTAPAPSAIGTFQDHATGRPTRAFMANAGHVPSSSTYETHGWEGGYTGKRDDGTLTVSTCTIGGDKETRPFNVYVNFYIKARG